jgi:hypothetical protein
MLLLSKGYYKPQANDPSEGAAGVGWFSSMEANMQRLNDHNHDGVNSQSLSTAAITRYTSTINPADWVSDGGGNYHFDVTVPAGISGAVAPLNDINSYSLSFINATTGERLLPTITRLTSTTFRVEQNDNTMTMTILYV